MSDEKFKCLFCGYEMKYKRDPDLVGEYMHVCPRCNGRIGVRYDKHE